VDPVNRRIVGVVAMILAIVVVTIGGASVAYSYWSGLGGGTGVGLTGTTAPLALSPGAATATLLPGGQSGVVLSMANPNPVGEKVSSLVLDPAQGTGGFGVDPAHGGCTLTSLSFSTQTNGGAGWTVPAKVGAVNGTLVVTLAAALSMSTAAVNACQGATFTVYLLAA
jgi:hypothetical protein